jgi:type VI secretion system secreted protein Hcp
MKEEFYVTIETEGGGSIEGDVDQKDREGQILGYAFDHAIRLAGPGSMGTGHSVASGSPTHGPVVFVKHVDKASPLIWQAMCNRQRLPKVTFDFWHRNDTGDLEIVYAIVLENVRVQEVETRMSDSPGGGAALREIVSLSYQAIEWEHKTEQISARTDRVEA